MNTLSKHLATIIVAVITIAGCIYAGRTEYNDDILSSMSAEKYKYIHGRLNEHASQEDVVKEYIAHQRYYDSREY